MNDPKILGVIPARHASTRFPGKPLVDIKGKSMIHRVYEQCQKAKTLSKVIVATDDSRIFDHVKDFGGAVEMTQEQHPSGTERVGEVAERHPEFSFVVNIQGDEPFISPDQIDTLATLIAQGTCDIATLIKPIHDLETLQNPNIVKVVKGNRDRALYFSRQVIPFLRDIPVEKWLEKADYFQHIGMYAFTRGTLLKVPHMIPSDLENLEKLEQLRWLANGFRIQTAISVHPSIGVDSPEDLQRLLDNFPQDG